MRGHIKSVDKTVPQVIMEPRHGHSVKPDEAMRRIERLFGPNTKKIELFARREVDGIAGAIRHLNKSCVIPI